jgi:hypothetical protein
MYGAVLATCFGQNPVRQQIKPVSHLVVQNLFPVYDILWRLNPMANLIGQYKI